MSIIISQQGISAIPYLNWPGSATLALFRGLHASLVMQRLSGCVQERASHQARDRLAFPYARPKALD